MISEAWLFQPGDVVYQHGRPWAGYVLVEGIKEVGPSKFPVYETLTAKLEVWYSDIYHWHGVGMRQGIPRDVLERMCTYVCQGWNGFYNGAEPITPIRPWWETDPLVFEKWKELTLA